jgi:hypothetical protein
MKKSSLSDTRKKPVGRPRVGAVPIMVRMPPAELVELDSWIKDHHPPRPSRPEAIRRLLQIGLAVPRPKRTSDKRARSAHNMAGKQLDQLADQSATTEEQAVRKRRLLKGPEEFQSARVDRPNGRRS